MLETRTTPAVIYGGIVSKLTLGLAAASDTGVAGNNVTESGAVTLAGTGPASARITLTRPGAASLTTTSGPKGNYAFTGVSLASGANAFTVTATNSAGQRLQAQTSVIRNTAPTVASAVSDFSVAPSSVDSKFNLPTIFSDTDVSSLVQFTTNRGTFQVELFDQQVGTTVANFLKYVTGTTVLVNNQPVPTSYANTIFHRKTVITNDPATNDGIAVLQGGGFKFTSDASGGHLNHIPTDAAIPLQSGLTNALGTIAMARTDLATSGTSEFFFNTANNTSLDPNGQPDSNNPGSGDGYAVFGAVRGSGMNVVNASYAVPDSSHGQFTEIPLDNYTGTNFPTDTTAANYEMVTGVSVIRRATPSDPDKLTFAATSSNTGLVTATVTGGELVLHYLTGKTGTSTITVSATDANGAKAQTTFKVTVADTTAPTVTVTSPPDGQTFTTNPTIQGKATDNVGVTKLQASVDGSTTLQDVAVDNQGNFSFHPNLATDGSADARHTVTFTAKDAAGNTSAAANFSFTLQTRVSVVTITAPPNNQTIRTNPTITGTTATGVTQLQATVDNQAPQNVPVNSGGFSFTPTLATDGTADGQHTVTFTSGSQFAPVTFTFKLDATGPAVTVTSPANGQTFTASPSIDGTVTDTNGVASLKAVVDNQPAQTVTFNAQGGFTFAPSVTTDGQHTVTFTAVDTPGNQSTPVVLTFTLDTAAPTLNVTSPPLGTVIRTSPTLSGTATDAGGTPQLTVSVDGGPDQTVQVGTQGDFSFDPHLPTDGTADGRHDYTFTARDGAGHTTTSDYWVFLDTTPPVATITGPADGQTLSSNPTISVTVSDNVGSGAANVFVDGVLVQEVFYNANTGFSYTTSLPTDGSADGPHTITFVAKDAAANESTPVDFHFTLQTQGP